MSTPHVPVSPGDHDRPDWWSEHDEAILAGELAKLADLPRPAALPQRQPFVPGAPARAPEPRLTGAVIFACAVFLLVAIVGAVMALGADARPAPSPCPGDPAGCADFITPTTYGPPGPAGGAFTSMPVR